jgi:beta-phosphoglucomutase-like phosphatase (HAD superfamily)
MRYKLICFDLDGTIIDDTIFIWQTIHEHFKTYPVRRRKLAEQYYQKKITYEDWASFEVEEWKKRMQLKKRLYKQLKH